MKKKPQQPVNPVHTFPLKNLSIKHKIKSLVKVSGVSQAELERLLKLPQGRISKMLAPSYDFRLSEICKFEKLFKCNILINDMGISPTWLNGSEKINPPIPTKSDTVI